jgi:hypothetical protein
LVIATITLVGSPALMVSGVTYAVTRNLLAGAVGDRSHASSDSTARMAIKRIEHQRESVTAGGACSGLSLLITLCAAWASQVLLADPV